MKTRIFLLTLMAVMLASIPFISGCGGGGGSSGLISRDTELSIGRDAARTILARYPRSNDPRLNNLVNGIGKDLVSVVERKDIPYTFIVLDTSEVNALSVPGYVFVDRGLIDFTNGDRNQLASVIAHEIAHITKRHTAIQVQQQLEASLAIRILAGGQRAEQLANLAANLALLGYGRSMELEADRWGMIYANRAGYDPAGEIRFFQHLQQAEKSEPRGLSVYFQTHPPTSERIRLAEQELQRIRSGNP